MDSNSLPLALDDDAIGNHQNINLNELWSEHVHNMHALVSYNFHNRLTFHRTNWRINLAA